MRRAWAIAVQTLLGSTRTMVVAATGTLVLLAVIVLPMVIKGDGTPEGEIKILLGYTLGSVGFLLSFLTLWSGCASLAPEIENRQAYMVVTKPVKPWQIWLGKTMGTAILNGILLLAAGCLLYGMLMHRLNSSQPDNPTAQLLEARSYFSPQLSPGDDHKAARHGKAISPGHTGTWSLTLPDTQASEPALHFQFKSSQIGFRTVTGRFSITSNTGAEHFQSKGAWQSDIDHRINLAEALSIDGPMTIHFENLNQPGGSAVFFPKKDGLAISTPGGTFFSNFSRALAALFIQLIFLAALGTTLSILFSSPMALFAALAILLASTMSGYINDDTGSNPLAGHTHGEVEKPSTGERVYLSLLRGMDKVFIPVRKTSALDDLVSGRVIPYAALAETLALRVILAGGLLALAGSFFLQRKELGAT